MQRNHANALLRAFALYLLWVGATYLLEGMQGTLVRPEAIGLRLAYAVVANLALGILLPLWLIRAALRDGVGSPADFGSSGPVRAAIGVAAGGFAGYALFAFSASGDVPSLAVVNAFAQVWVVSVAEIVVCWALVGASVRIALRSWSRAGSVLTAAAVASVLFGVYHFAHSPPFNQFGMVVFLTGIGFATSIWWFASRELYGTAVFHNFFGVTGVLAALKAAGQVPAQPQLGVPVLVTAGVVTVALAWAAIVWVRPARL
jgi:hypothetical protein